MVGMVPDMFQVPINAPTPNRMKMAVVTEAMPWLAASATASQRWPFFSTTAAVTIEVSSNATCNGPLVASMPNSEREAAINTTSVTSGSNASKYDGSLVADGFSGCAFICFPKAMNGWSVFPCTTTRCQPCFPPCRNQICDSSPVNMMVNQRCGPGSPMYSPISARIASSVAMPCRG